MKYRIKLKPLGKYFFGGEKRFKKSTYKGEKPKSYYIKSRALPQQTSVLGMLRFEVLKQFDGFDIKKYSEYTSEDHNQMKKLIGSESFSIEEDNQDFGCIQLIGPVNLYHEEKGLLNKTPFNHNISNGDKGFYTPYQLKSYDGFSNHKGVCILEEYNPKSGLTNNWLTVKNAIVENDTIFKTYEEVGNLIIDKKEDDEKGFFKQDFKTLNNHFYFTFALEIDGSIQLKDSIVELGKERSSFFMTIEEITNETKLDTYDDKIIFRSDAFLTREQLDKIRENTKFSIVQENEFRNLRRKKGNENYQFVEMKYNFIKKSSVYYLKDDKKSDILTIIRNNKNLLKIGYNQVD